MLAFMIDLAQIAATATLAVAVMRLTDVLRRLAALLSVQPAVLQWWEKHGGDAPTS